MQIEFIGHGLNSSNKLNVGDQLYTSFIDKKINYDTFIGFVAFSAISGVSKLLPSIKIAKQKFKKIVFYIGVDNMGTSKQALELLLENEIETYIYHRDEEQITFHPKLYIFEGEKFSRVIIGSSNLTHSGFLNNIESSVQLDFNSKTDKQGNKFISDIKSYYQQLLNLTDKHTRKLTVDLIKEYDEKGLLYSQFKNNIQTELQNNDGENPEIKSIENIFYQNEFGNGLEQIEKPNYERKIIVTENDFEVFDFFLEKYKKYKVEVRSSGVVNKDTDQTDLLNWYNRMKEFIKLDILPKEFEIKLSEAGFPLENGRSLTIRMVWDENYEKLLEFKEKEQKHLDFTYVPQTKNQNSPYYSLGGWCTRQKRRRKGIDTPEWDWDYEENKMKALNYLWEIPDNFNIGKSRNDESWTDRLLELEEYYENEGNKKSIPHQHTKLGKWLNEQITSKLTGSRGKNKVFLHPIREALLGDVLKRNNIEWEWQKQKERESIENVIEKWKIVTQWDKKSKREQDEQKDNKKAEIKEYRQLISQTRFRAKKWQNEESKWKIEMLLKVGFPLELNNAIE